MARCCGDLRCCRCGVYHLCSQGSCWSHPSSRLLDCVRFLNSCSKPLAHAFCLPCSVIYMVILLVCAATYIYLYYQVRKFFASLPRLKSNHNLILRVSIRLLFTAVTFLLLVIAGILTASPPYWTAYGQAGIQAFVVWSLCANSTLTISAFAESTLKSRAASSSAGSGNPGSRSLSSNSSSAETQATFAV